MIIKEDSLPP